MAADKSNPFGEIVFAFGAFSLVAVAAIEIFSLGYYGLGLSSEPSAYDNINSQRWPEQVKSNIQLTYAYLFASFYVCITAAMIVYSSPALFRAFSSAAMMIVDFVVESVVQYGRSFALLSSEGGLSPQKLAWFGYCCFLGGLASPALLFGPDTAKISIHLTFFIVFVLTLISLTAPAGKFVSWEKNLRIFELVVLVGTVASSVFPITTRVGAVSFALSFYGGLILFQLFFLCHSQEAHMTAYRATQRNPYCAPAMSVPMLLDAISIFSRIVLMIPSP